MVLLVLATVFLSEITKAWMLYLGLVFLFMVMYAPGGIAGLIMMNLRLAKYGKLGRIFGAYLALLGTGLAMVVGFAALVEMLYHLQLNSGLGSELRFMGTTLNVHSVDSWVGAGLIFLTGLGLFELVRRQYMRQWGEIQEEIEHDIQRRESV